MQFLITAAGTNTTTGRTWAKGAPMQKADGTPFETEWVQLIGADGKPATPKLGIVEVVGYAVRAAGTGTKGAFARQYVCILK